MSMNGRVLGALAACLLVLPATSGAPASAAPGEADVVGRWDVTVTIDLPEGPTYAPLYCDLGADHQLHCESKPGFPPLEGRGIWTLGKGNNFGFWITHHAHLDENGDPTGSIYSEHVGKITRREFTTTAFTFIDMHDGTPWTGPVPVGSVGHRV